MALALLRRGLGVTSGISATAGDRVGPHGDEQQTQHDHEAHQLIGRRPGGVAVVQRGEEVHQDHRPGGAPDDIGRPAAHPGGCPVGQSSEEGQQEQGQHVVRRHDDAGEGFVHVEGLPEDQGHQVVVHLPEGADGEEGWLSAGFLLFTI